jgi:general stress protein YciG
MSSTVAVGSMEVSSNHESAQEMVAALKPSKEASSEPRVVSDAGKDTESEPDLSEHMREIGKKGGEASARARAEQAKAAEAKPEPEAKPQEDKPEGADPEADKPGNPRHDARARVMEATRKLAEERKRADALEARLAALEAGRAPEQPKPAAEAGAPAQAGGRYVADPDDPEPDPSNFETYEEAVRETARWVYRQERKAEQRAAEQRAQVEQHTQALTSTMDGFLGRLAKAREATPDLETRIDPRLTALVPAFTLPPGQEPGPLNVLGQELIESEHSAELMLYLSEHEEEVVALLKSPSPAALARGVGRLEAKLAGQPEPEAPREKPVSRAPAPLRPVTPSSVPDSDVTGDMDFDTYMRRKRR